MIPILYDYNETAFISNGLGRLSDCISCTVKEERNGPFECEFTYPVTGIHFEDITEGRIVAVTHDDSGDVQPFDIYASSKPIDGVVTFYAHHISYRLAEAVAPSVVTVWYNPQTPQTIFSWAKSRALGSVPFTFQTDITSTAIINISTPLTFRQLLGGVEGSFLDTFGGEYEWDKWNVILHSSRGANNGVRIMYGKNLASFNSDTDYAAAYNAVVGYWRGQAGDTNAETFVKTGLVSSGQTLPNGRTVVVPLDLSDKFNSKPTVAQLTAAARAYMTANHTWNPAQTMDVDFVQLWQTEEYRDFAPLQKCHLCDSVNVSFGMYGLADMAIKIVAVEWDALAERYTKMTLGGIATSLGESISAGLSGSINAAAQTAQIASSRVTDVQVNGSSVVTDGVASLPTIPTKTSDLTNDSGFLKAPSLESATILSPYSGSLNYLKLGRIVIFDGTIAANGALSNGAALANGLPANHTNNSLFFALNNNSTSETVGMYISNDGSLRVRGSLASSNRSFRISGAYIAAS